MSRFKLLEEKFKTNQKKYENLDPFYCVYRLKQENEELKLRNKGPK